MAKGLSNLQKTILLLAYTRGGTAFEHRGRQVATSDVDVSTGDILREIFKSKTNTTRASVSRALKRLKERGLVKRRYQYSTSGDLVYSGIKLTDAGREKAKGLTVNTLTGAISKT